MAKKKKKSKKEPADVKPVPLVAPEQADVPKPAVKQNYGRRKRH